MTLTAIVGALVALVPAFRPKGDKVKERKPPSTTKTTRASSLAMTQA